MAKLIGTNPSQVPTCGDLGTAAFVDIEQLQDLSSKIGKFVWNSATSSSDTYAANNVSSWLIENLYDQIKGCVLNSDGSVNYYLNPEDWSKKADGTASDLTGTDGNVMVEIPKFYYRHTRDGSLYTWEVSLFDGGGFTVHPAFVKDGTEVSKRYFGAYDACLYDDSASAYVSGLNLDDMTSNIDAANDLLASVKGVYPLVGVTRAECRTLASNNGSGWRQLDYTLFSAVQMLYLVEYQSFYSQNILGAGNTNGSYVASSADQNDSPHTIAGAGDSIANGSTDTTSGAGVSAKPGTSFMKYRGIENLYGNCWTWADGILVNDVATGNVYIGNNSANWSDTDGTGMDLVTGDYPTSNSYVTDLLPVEAHFLASNGSGGSSSTYITDQQYKSASADRVVRVGGTADNGGAAGVFCLNATNDASNGSRYFGGRLAF